MHYDEYIDVEKNINHLPVKQMERVEDYVDFPLNKCLGTAEPSVAAEAEKIMRKSLGTSSASAAVSRFSWRSRRRELTRQHHWSVSVR